jgi:hypothetical protein
MGEARIRGTLEQRKAQAIKSGRKNRKPIHYIDIGSSAALAPLANPGWLARALLAVADLAVGPKRRTVEQLRAER